MKIEVVLNTKKANDEITELNDYIREQNLKGMMTKVGEREPEPGEMSVADYMPIIELVLGSSVVAAGVKGLFDIFKNFFELKKERIRMEADIEKTKMEQHKIAFNVETDDGKKINLHFASFDDKEREQFFKMVDKVFKR